MATRSGKESKEDADRGTGTAQRKIHWDDSKMRSVYANVCNVAGTQEEIVLLFGMNQAWHSAQEAVTIQLEDRIVLSPFVAKRLALLLNNVLRDYESKYGPLVVGQSATTQ